MLPANLLTGAKHHTAFSTNQGRNPLGQTSWKLSWKPGFPTKFPTSSPQWVAAFTGVD